MSTSAVLRLLVSLLILHSSLLSAFEKPTGDEREYRALTLENGLSVLLISDSDALTSGVAVNVGVGMNADPPGYPGLAHLLEHMVFSGSTRFPERGGFQSFLNRHSGGVNFRAYTASDQTAFMFQLPSKFLDDALSRFSDFLTAPLLSADDIEKEIQIVDHEYQAKADDQNYQELSAYKRALDPSHPYSRSFMGSRASLDAGPPEALKKALHKLFDRSYTARNMKLVVFSSQSLAALETKVDRYFSRLQTVADATAELSPPLELTASKAVEIYVAGTGGVPRLTLKFPFTLSAAAPGPDPFVHFSRLIASESEWGVKHYLTAQGLITDLKVRPGHITESVGTLDIVMPLTQTGLDRTDEITAAVLAFIGTLKQEGVREDLYQEARNISRRRFDDFDFYPLAPSLAFLARAMQIFPTNQALSRSMLLSGYDPVPLQSFIDRLSPKKMAMIIYRPGKRFPNEDPHSDATYLLKTIPDTQQERWSDDAAMPTFLIEPGSNPYLATETQRDKSSEESTALELLELAEDSEGFTAWFKHEESGRNRSTVYLGVSHPVVFQGDNSQSMKQLYAFILSEALSEIRSKGEEAELSLRVTPAPHGIDLRLQGPTATQRQFLFDVLAVIRSLDISEHHLRYGKKGFERSADQYRTGDAIRRLLLGLFAELNPTVSNPEQQLQAVEDVELKELQAFHEAFWERPSVNMMIHGSMSPDVASGLATQVQDELGGQFRKNAPAPAAIGALPENRRRLYDPAIPQGSLLLYARQPRQAEKSAVLLLAAKMLHGHLFDAVRGDKALGYNVYATTAADYRHEGVIVGLQVPGMTPEETELFLKAEIDDFSESLAELSDDEFIDHKMGAKSIIDNYTANGGSLSDYWWMMLNRYGGPVDGASIAKRSLSRLSMDEFSQFVSQLFFGEEAEVYLRVSSGEALPSSGSGKGP